MHLILIQGTLFSGCWVVENLKAAEMTVKAESKFRFLQSFENRISVLWQLSFYQRHFALRNGEDSAKTIILHKTVR